MPQAVTLRKATVRRICRQYKKGWSLGRLAASFKRSVTLIRRILAASKVKIRGPGRQKGSKNRKKRR